MIGCFDISENISFFYYADSYKTGADMETKASNVLKSNKYSDDTKSLAASVLSQSNKKR